MISQPPRLISGYQYYDGNFAQCFLRGDDMDATVSYYSFNLYSGVISGASMEGKLLYTNEKGSRDAGTFTLTRTADIYK